VDHNNVETPAYYYHTLRNELIDVAGNPTRLRDFHAAVAFAVVWTIANREGFPERKWEDLTREEKANIGIAIQREVSRACGWQFGVLREYSDTSTSVPDAIIFGVPVEIKTSTRSWFGIRAAQVDHWAILFDIDPVHGDIRVGLFFIKSEHLTEADNDASKKSLNADALREVEWLIEANFLGQVYRAPGERNAEIRKAEKAAEKALRDASKLASKLADQAAKAAA
jgi:hypothetical protein